MELKNMDTKKFVDEMRLYNSKYKIEVGPAFRFGHLWKPQVLKEETQSNFIVLVAGSIFLDESINIVKLTISSIKRINLNEIKFFVKLHPTMNMENFKNQIGVNWAKDINDVKDMDSKSSILYNRNAVIKVRYNGFTKSI